MGQFKREQFLVDGSRPFAIGKMPTKIKDIYDDKKEYDQMLSESIASLDEMQNTMYAHNRYGLLVIFQALDAAGKDGTVRHVLSGVNPAGIRVHSFKRPTSLELEHDFMWRTSRVLPERGTITIFNRSYYEEVLVVKVHPEILTERQLLPDELKADVGKVMTNRYKDIRNFEKYLYRNGIRVVKFFLHISKTEQADRLIERIQDPWKNWKFEEGDVKERGYWNEYQQAFEDCINETATPKCPWYVIPADDKKNMRLIVGKIIGEEMKKLDISYPETSPEREEALQKYIEIIREQNKS
jgi:PPK2 family polyphosphate:nucleotide phosphotransferase